MEQFEVDAVELVNVSEYFKTVNLGSMKVMNKLMLVSVYHISQQEVDFKNLKNKYVYLNNIQDYSQALEKKFYN